MTHPLLQLELEALQLKNAGKFFEAAELFSIIVDQQADWEHGLGLLNLAQCYDDLGQLEMAKKSYGAALGGIHI